MQIFFCKANLNFNLQKGKFEHVLNQQKTIYASCLQDDENKDVWLDFFLRKKEVFCSHKTSMQTLIWKSVKQCRIFQASFVHRAAHLWWINAKHRPRTFGQNSPQFCCSSKPNSMRCSLKVYTSPNLRF